MIKLREINSLNERDIEMKDDRNFKMGCSYYQPAHKRTFRLIGRGVSKLVFETDGGEQYTAWSIDAILDPITGGEEMFYYKPGDYWVSSNNELKYETSDGFDFERLLADFRYAKQSDHDQLDSSRARILDYMNDVLGGVFSDRHKDMLVEYCGADEFVNERLGSLDNTKDYTIYQLIDDYGYFVFDRKDKDGQMPDFDEIHEWFDANEGDEWYATMDEEHIIRKDRFEEAGYTVEEVFSDMDGDDMYMDGDDMYTALFEDILRDDELKNPERMARYHSIHPNYIEKCSKDTPVWAGYPEWIDEDYIRFEIEVKFRFWIKDGEVKGELVR